MSVWNLLWIVAVAGAFGGFMNAFMTNNGFVMPHREKGNGTDIVRPGFLGNVIVGAVAAAISWGLYGPLSNELVFGAPGTDTRTVGLSLSALVGALLVGVGGARWLTNEVDKKLLKAAARKAARSKAVPHKVDLMAEASPIEVFNIAKDLPEEAG